MKAFYIQEMEAVGKFFMKFDEAKVEWLVEYKPLWKLTKDLGLFVRS